MEGKSGTVNLNFTGKDTNLRARNGAGYLLKNLVLSEGTIIIGQAAPENLSDSLTINGSYVAKDGNLYLNGQLGADNSPEPEQKQDPETNKKQGPETNQKQNPEVQPNPNPAPTPKEQPNMQPKEQPNVQPKTQPKAGVPIVRPEIETYTANAYAANNAFNMSYLERGNERIWARFHKKKTKFDNRFNTIDQTANVTQLGIDVFNTSKMNVHHMDTLRVGIMGGYANIHTDAKGMKYIAKGMKYNAKGTFAF